MISYSSRSLRTLAVPTFLLHYIHHINGCPLRLSRCLQQLQVHIPSQQGAKQQETERSRFSLSHLFLLNMWQSLIQRHYPQHFISFLDNSPFFFFLKKRWISQDILPFIYSSIYPHTHPSIHPNSHPLKDPLRLSSTTISVLVSQSYLTLCDPMGSSPPGTSAHGTLQARILECIAISFSEGFSQPRDRILISLSSSLVGRFSTVWATREANFY